MATANDYLNAFSELNRAEQELRAIARMIEDVSEALNQRPPKIPFIDVPAYSDAQPRPGSPSSSNWVSAHRISDAVTAVHEAQHRVLDIWHQLPPDARSGLQPPTGAR